MALAGWMVAATLAFILVAHTGFFGVAAIGLVIAYVGTQVELDADRPVASSLSSGFLGAQLRAQETLTAEQRAARRHERSLGAQSARFFRHLGLALLLIGLAGGVWTQL